MSDPFAKTKPRRKNGAKYPALKQKVEALDREERGLPPKVPEDIFCPISGQKLEIRPVKTSFPGVFSYMAVGPFWISKSWPTVRQLKWVLCHRNGEAPPFGPSEVESVVHREPPPPSTVADQLKKDDAVEQNALDMIERVVNGDADPKIFVQPGGLKS